MKLRPRTQLLLKLGVFLLLGVVVNVAVAWGCAQYSRRTVFAMDDIEYWTEGPGWRHARKFGTEEVYISVGAPAFCVAHQRTLPAELDVLQWRPLWPGFAINTIFYAALLWVLFYGPGKVRRLVRIRRWCCPACGYKIAPGGGIGPRCSECGHVLRD